jgi:uncharacterized protein YbbK (DUF523 family)
MSEHKVRLQETVAVSACLLGVRCRFDGGSVPSAAVIAWLEGAHFLPVCPEQLGGLPTPRPRHERIDGRVVSEHGQDATDAFERGAQEALRLMKLAGARRAVLKARSPSCGKGQIYDGTFAGKLMPGHGVFATLLLDEGYEVWTEEETLPARFPRASR